MIETERLILRKFTLDDVESSYQMNLDPNVNQYTHDGGVQSIKTIKERIKKDVLGDYEKYGFGRLAVILKSSNQFIGFAGLKYLEDLEEVDLGYRLVQNQWGKGIATEACIPILKYGFNVLKLKQIIGLVIPENIASIKVLEKLGFQFKKFKIIDDQKASYYVLKNLS